MGAVPGTKTGSTGSQDDSALELRAAVRRSVAEDPNNVSALSALIMEAITVGDFDEAHRLGASVRMVKTPTVEDGRLVAYALSMVGDDEGVLEAYERAKQRRDKSIHEPDVHHLAGVAELRLGNEKAARRCWALALRVAPGYPPTMANLSDLALPVGQRNGPFPFLLQDWMTGATFTDLGQTIVAATKVADDDSGIAESICSLLDRRPEIAALVPVLLERGDPQGRGAAAYVAVASRREDMARALRDFALSTHGSDTMRMAACRDAMRGGSLEPGIVRFWQDGKWQDGYQFGFEITGEAIRSFRSPEIEDLARLSIEAMRANDATRAERLLTKIRKLDPDALDVLNNLAKVYEMQGRRDAAYELVREIHRRDPDYFFGRLGMAGLLLDEEKIDEARAMVEPLLHRRKVHVSEFRALCGVQIMIAIYAKEVGAAETWLDLLQESEPDSPAVAYYGSLIDTVELSASVEEARPLHSPRARKPTR